MPRYTDTNGQTVTSDIALDASGRLRTGFRSVLQHGESVHFDITMRDSAASFASSARFMTDAPEPFVSPAQARQAEIMADVARTAAARQIVCDGYIAEQVAATMVDRSLGRRSDVVEFARAAQYGPGVTAQAAASAASVADNAHVVSAIRAACYA